MHIIYISAYMYKKYMYVVYIFFCHNFRMFERIENAGSTLDLNFNNTVPAVLLEQSASEIYVC